MNLARRIPALAAGAAVLVLAAACAGPGSAPAGGAPPVFQVDMAWPQPLARDPELPSAGQPQLEACTRYQRLACFEWPFSVDGRHPTSRYALVSVEPLTGRRHQIRRHFKHIAHPLVGDTTHGKGAHNRAVAQWLGTARLWLHCEWMELPGRPRITAPPGPEWNPLLG